jgi:hypothetical protein
MLGFSLGKLLVLALIVGAVWYGFKYYARIEAKRAAEERLRKERRRARPAPKRESVEDAETMVQCPVCKVYQPAGDTAPCDRADCPY